jgi:multidrug transporter EmrE-like cation transporter
MINGVNVGIILGIVIIETAVQTFARKFYDFNHEKGVETDGTKNFYLIAFAFLLYGVILTLLLQSYNYSDFAITNALWDSGTVIGTGLVGYFYFGETFKWQELVGLGLVVSGAIIIGAYSRDVSKETV